jgi:uncharacterized delta-60 repeat protein
MKNNIFAVVLCVLLFSGSIFAAGVLDQNFGAGGKALFRFGETTDFALDAALQPDGKIVIAGVTCPSGQSGGFRDFALVRLNSDGTYDNAFGVGGKVVTSFPGVTITTNDTAYSLTILPDGKLLVGGGSDQRIAMARYNPDGSLDNTFGTGGKFTYDLEESLAEGVGSLAVLPDGKFMIGTQTSGVSPEPPNQIVFLRFNSNGTQDLTFGANGKLKILFGRLTYFGGATALPDGKFLIGAGYVYNMPGCVPTKHTSCEAGRELLMRYTADMRPDRKFGFNGKLSPVGGFGMQAILADGNYLSGGDPVRRFYPNGYLQRAFDRYTFPGDNQTFLADALKEKADGRIVGCGRLGGGNGYDDVGVIVFSPEGHVAGTDRRDFFTGNDSCSKLLIQPDGKVVLVGSYQSDQQAPYGFLVMRYTDFTL